MVFSAKGPPKFRVGKTQFAPAYIHGNLPRQHEVRALSDASVLMLDSANLSRLLTWRLAYHDLLLDLGSNAVEQLDLMPESLPIKDQSSLMEAMDRVNARFGKGTLRVGSAGWEHQDDAGWRMRQESRSPRYTTRLDEALIVRA